MTDGYRNEFKSWRYLKLDAHSFTEPCEVVTERRFTEILFGISITLYLLGFNMTFGLYRFSCTTLKASSSWERARAFVGAELCDCHWRNNVNSDFLHFSQ